MNDHDRTREHIRIAAILAAAAAVLGGVVLRELKALHLERPRLGALNVFEVLFFRFEPPFLVLLLVFAIAVLVSIHGEFRGAGLGEKRHAPVSPKRTLRGGVAVIALLVVAGSALGAVLVFRNYPLSMDEFAATFQARIFARGQREAWIPTVWQPFASALTPIFIEYKPATGTWFEAYLPVYAAIRAFFLLIGLERWTNPALAGASIFLIALVARRLWPDRNRYVLLAALFLASSSQFLLMSMSVAYSMPAHLCVNLLWLYLLLSRPASRQRLAVPWVGAAAMGLHNPFPHALFAAPFFLRLVRERRFRTFAYWLAVYGFAAAGWLAWMFHSYLETSPAGGVGQLFGIAPHGLLLPRMGGVLTLTWQSPVVAILALFAILSWRRIPPLARDLAAGLILTSFFYCFFPAGQGHGWGYRFIFGALGNLILLAVFAVPLLEVEAAIWTRRLIGASLITSFAFQIPLRAYQAAVFTSPFAEVASNIQRRHSAVVLVDDRAGWYWQDFVRNGPFLEEGPKTMFKRRLSAPLRERLATRFSVEELYPENGRPRGGPQPEDSR